MSGQGLEGGISRRAALLGGGAILAWKASPVRAALESFAHAPATATIEALISQMTIAEKAGQLTMLAAAWGSSGAPSLNPASKGQSFEAQLENVRAMRLTGVFNGNGAEMARRMQSAAMESRLRIPLIFAADVIHGFRTIFPIPLGEAASFDPSLAQRCARMAAVEATASGIDWTFAPMVDIARDQRWGRTMEGAGEDVLLGELMAAARVRGFQGHSLSSPDAMLSCAKHFAAYGAAEAGLDYNSVEISERGLREIYLPPFKAAFDAGAHSAMASFNEIDGVPSTANAWLMNDLLRGEWGFDGFVVSDFAGDAELVEHGFAADEREATRLAFMAGVDMSLQSGFYAKYLPGLIERGEVPLARLDQSVRRVLTMKARLGLFDDPFGRIDRKRETANVLTKPALALAREAARDAIVMLRNEGDLLPLRKDGLRIAIIGPFATGPHHIDGNWVVYGDQGRAVDLAEGIKAAVADPAMVTISHGSGIEEPLLGGIEEALAAARAADVVILAVGEGERMSGEAQSRTEIVVPPPQQELAEAVAATGKPIVVLLKNGRALALNGAIASAPAILVTWFLGTQSGHAIADILFGDQSPSGRLPCSFPRASGQQPYYYAHKPTGRPNPPGELQPYKAHFRKIPNLALYPFGHGLTYGSIVYSDLKVSPEMAWEGELALVATILNQGRRGVREVVQLYIHDRVASVTRPVRELKAFQKIDLAPGQSKKVAFSLRREQLAFIGLDNRPTVEPGDFDVWIAPSAEAEGLHASFELRR